MIASACPAKSLLSKHFKVPENSEIEPQHFQAREPTNETVNSASIYMSPAWLVRHRHFRTFIRALALEVALSIGRWLHV